MQLEIWADVTCPWCGLGIHRLNQAVARFEHGDAVDITHRSYQLDPQLPGGVELTVRQLLRDKYGMSDAEVEAANHQVEQFAERDGLRPYHALNNRVGNTALAHEYLAYASTKGRHTEAWRGIFRAHFGEARSVYSIDDLLPLAEDLGLDRDETRTALAERRFRSRVEDDVREAYQLGVRGVPFLAIDRRFAVAGAQDIETLLSALRTAWAKAPSSG